MPDSMLYKDVMRNKQELDPAFFVASEKYNINKVRGDYSRAAKNKDPVYKVPKSHKDRLPLIRDLVAKAQNMDVTISDVAMYSRATGERKKHFYPDRSKAINALVCVFGEYLNLVTHQIQISLRNASDAAGLSTISDNELKKVKEEPSYVARVSISRASRAFRDMIKMGWIVAQDNWQTWDDHCGHWSDKYYEATPLFFKALGITAERVEKHRMQRLKYLKDKALKAGLTPEAVGRMSITQIKAERKLAWHRNALDRRKKEQARKKVTRQLKDRNRAEQRKVAIDNIIKSLGNDLANIEYSQFIELVNKEIATLRKFSNLKPPLH